MLSQRKVVVRVAEVLAALGSAGYVLAAIGVAAETVAASSIEPLLAALFVMSFVVFGTAVVLFHEFARVLRGEPSGWFREHELSFAEMKLLIRWCPAPMKLSFVAAVMVLTFQLYTGGSVEWSSGQPFTKREAQGFLLFMAAFMLVALPILASSARMPGSFEEQFSGNRSGKNGV